MKRKLLTILVVLALIFVGTSCTKDTPETTARFQLKLTDAPSFLYSHINIDIQGIDVYVGNTIQGNAQVNDGWISLKLKSVGVVNLLDFMNGKLKLLVDQQIPACTIKKVRFKLGGNCSVQTLITGEIFELHADRSFSFDVDWNIEAGEEYSFVVDINAYMSVELIDFTPHFNPEPYINTFLESFGGNVSGYVHPATAVKYIKITKGSKTFYTIPDLLGGTIDGTDRGFFAFICLEPGNWTITFVTKEDSGYQTKEVPVTIVAGETFQFSEIIELVK